MIKSPFKFLDAYTLNDRDIFFGRDHEVTDLYRKVFESKILLVYGVSGTGKSSLINCGLASRFDESDWLPINIRRGSNIIESLNDAINKVAINPLKENFTISEKLQSIYLDHFKPVYLIFDQFEELFIFGAPEERGRFIKIIKEIARSKTQCRTILVIREEFLAGITEFEEELPEIFSNRFRVEKMKRANAVLAVEGPCRVNGIKTEAGFSDELINKICPVGNEIELTYFQIYLDRIFRLSLAEQEETREISFSKAVLAKAGSVSDLLGQFLEEQIHELDNPDTGMSILKSFVSVQGTRKQMTETEIINAIGAFGIKLPEQDLLKYLTKFVDLRILRERDEAGHFELRHDALAAKIYEKITLVEKEILEVRQFIENAYHIWENRKVYLSAEDLEYISPYEDKLYLNKKLEQFIHDSKNVLLRARRQRRRIITVSMAILFTVLAVLTGWALNERGKAVEQSKLAEEKRKEAVTARDDAIIAQNEANVSKQEAISAKDDALYQKNLADSALVIAETHRRTSDEQRTRAEELYVDANNQRQKAQEAQDEAERSAKEVIETSRRAMYQLYLFNAKEFANKSLLMSKNDTLKALLALKAYDLVNYGYHNYASASDALTYDIVILEALQKAYDRFESNVLFSGEIWASDVLNDQILFSDTLGRVEVTWLRDQVGDKYPVLNIAKSVSLPSSSFVRALATDNTGQRAAIGTTDGAVFLLSADNTGNNILKEIYRHDKRVLSLVFIPEKNWLISSSLDNNFKIWDLAKGEFIKVIKANNIIKNLVLQGLHSVVFSDDKGSVFLWDLDKIDTEPALIFHNSKPIDAIAFEPLHKRLAVATEGEVMLFLSPEINTNSSPGVFSDRHKGIISALKFSPDGRWLCSAGFDGTVMLWDLEEVTGNSIENIVPISLDNKNMNILSLVFDKDSRYLLFADNSNLHICAVDLEGVYRKLRAKMGKRVISRAEWDYYKKGDISFSAQ